MALCVVAIWGTNFVVIRLGLDDLPPLFLAAVRFFFVVFPLVFFLFPAFYVVTLGPAVIQFVRVLFPMAQ